MKRIFSYVGLIAIFLCITQTSIWANTKPVAVRDVNTCLANTFASNNSATTSVLLNDNDADVGQTLSLLSFIVVAPAHGVTSVSTLNGTITYTPNPYFCGIDSFSYIIQDNGVPNMYDTAFVVITVGGGIPAPFPTNITFNGIVANVVNGVPHILNDTINPCYSTNVTFSATPTNASYTIQWLSTSTIVLNSNQVADTIIAIGPNESGNYFMFQIDNTTGCGSPEFKLNIKPQACCPPNIDFEYGNFSFWNYYKGTNTVGPPTFPATTTVPSPANSNDRIILTPNGFPNATVTNPVPSPGNLDLYGGFPIQCPAVLGGGGFSCRVGNDNTGSEADRVVYYIKIPSGNNNYNVIYNWAAVLNDPTSGHTSQQLPGFQVKIYDSLLGPTTQINCASLSFLSNSSLPGWNVSPLTAGGAIRYHSWSQQTIGLNGLAGRTIALEFTSYDCTQGGHFGYAYVDVGIGCSVSAIVQGYCPGSTTAGLNGPPGFQSYVWYDATLINQLGTSQNLVLNPAPTQPTGYYLALFPYAGFGCPDTIYTLLTAQPPPVANFLSPWDYCVGSVVQLWDSSYTLGAGTYINHWEWNFGDPFATPTNPNIDSTSQNPQHIYSQMGTYTIMLIAKSNIACVSDTTFHTIHINQAMPPLAMSVSNDTLCGPVDSVVINYTGTIKPNFTYYYTIDTSCYKLVSGSLTGTGPINLKFNCNGLHTVTFYAIPPPGDTTCRANIDIPIYVKGQFPTIFLFGLDTICLHDAFGNLIKDTISILGAPTTCGPSPVGCPGGSVYATGSNNGNTASNVPTPFRGNWTKSKCQMLVLASELTSLGYAGGPISEIGWNILNKASGGSTIGSGCSTPWNYSGFTISMACVPYTDIYTGSSPSTLDVTTPLTMVYTTNSYSTTLGMNNFVLQTPYVWDGVSNLLIQTCFDACANGSYYTSDDRVAKSTNASISSAAGLAGTANLCAFAYTDAAAQVGCGPIFGSAGNGNLGGSTERPDIFLKACSGKTTPTTTWSWTSNPPGLISSNDTLIVTPLVTTTYTVVGDDGGCQTSQSFVVNQMLKNTVSAGADTTFCGNAQGVSLIASATGPVPTSPVPCGLSTMANCSGTPTTVTAGTGNDVTTTITPFNANYSNHRMLMRYTAASLQAAFGIAPGTPYKISSLAFNITSKNSYLPHYNFKINISCIHKSLAMPTAFVGGMSTVYGPVNVTTTTGWNNFPFATSYDWDGASDLLVEICYGSAISSASDVVAKTAQAGNCVLWAGNIAGASGCTLTNAGPNTFGSSNLLPNARFTGCPIAINAGAYNFFWSSIPPSVIPNNTNDTLQVNPAVTTTYVVQLMGSYCPIFDTVVVHVIGTINLKVRPDTVVCPGSTVPLWASGNGIPTNGWTWSTMYGGTLSGCANCSTPSVTVMGTDSVIVVATQPSTGCKATDTISIIQHQTPTAQFTMSSPVCQGSPSLVTYIGSGTAAGTYTWNWDGGQVLSGSGQGPYNVYWNSGGVFTPKLIVNDFGCTSFPDSASVVVIPTLTSDFIKNSPHCVGDSLKLTYTGTSAAYPGLNYKWMDKNNVVVGTTKNLALKMTSPGKYYIKLQTSVGPTNLCPSIVTIDSVTIYPNPVASIQTTPNAICTGSPINILFNGTVSTGASPNPPATTPVYNWTWSGGVATPITSNPPSYDVVWNTVPSKVSVVQNVTLTVDQDGCSDTTNVNVTIHPYPVAKISANPGLTCAGVPVTITSAGSTYQNAASTTFAYAFPNGSPLTANTKGPHNVTYMTTSGIKTEVAYLTITENGCTSNTDSVLITVYPIPTGNFSFSPNPICSGQVVNFNYTGTTNPNSSGQVTFNWAFTNGSPNKAMTAGPHNVRYNNGTATQVHYPATLIVTQDGCSSIPVTQNVDVNPLPDPLIVGPFDLCVDQTSPLTVTPTFVSYLWSTGSTNDSIFVTGAADVFVYVTDANGCTDSASHKVTGHALPIANAGPDQIIFIGNAAHLDGSASVGGNAYLWSPANTLDNPVIVGPNASPSTDQDYILTYYNSAFGCMDKDTMHVTIRQCDALRIPNAFAPSSDVENDRYFNVLNPDDFYRLVRLEVYNRWGQLMYATNDKNSKGWDGKFRGEEQEMGTYIYNVIAECGGGKLIYLKGDVTLVR